MHILRQLSSEDHQSRIPPPVELLLELGVGEMTPGIITLPFWSMAAKLPDAHLLSVNISSGSVPLQLGSKAEAIQADLGALLSAARTGGE
jgi:hypothetical protein